MRNALRRLSILACIVGWLGSAAWSQPKPSGGFKVGMAYRRFVPHEPYDWRGAQTHALVTVIWYPGSGDAQEQPVKIPGLTGFFELPPAAQDAKVSTQRPKFPLIVLSHGTGGSGLSVAWFGAALAAHGYIVAAVNHPGNNATEPYSGRGFSTWWERARDLSTVIDFMLADEQFGSRIDASRIAAAGFSLGGYTMIEIAGGTTDPGAFQAFCASPKNDGICKSPPEFPTLVEDFDRLSRTDPDFQAALRHAGDSYRDPRVRAVFAMAPALGPAFPAAGLARIAIPVRIVAGESDTNVPVASSARYFAANIPGAKLTLFPGAVGHYVFLDTCTAAARGQNPMLCADGAEVDRDDIHAKTVSLAVEFFGNVLAKAAPLQVYVYTADDHGYNVNSTVLYGDTEALLIDTQYRAEDAEKAAEAIAALHRKLKAIFITHPDADHFSGAAVLIQHFPGTPVYMTPAALAEFKRTASKPGSVPDLAPLPATRLSLDGKAVEFLEDLQGDYPARPANSMVWVPSTRTLIADDVVFSGIHPWLADSTPAIRAAWIKSLERVASFHAARLVPGHQRSPAPADPVAFTRTYLETFDQLRASSPDADTLVREMEKRFPDLGQPGFLVEAAKSSYKK